jgi:hypothetical protein|mmetsp:Transcript_20304/g.54618  ORF Transcript_20304/g.54618 Transcript_20304/m.54618 type:complete len:208 (-) Transcript_20304:115-738(-)
MYRRRGRYRGHALPPFHNRFQIHTESFSSKPPQLQTHCLRHRLASVIRRQVQSFTKTHRNKQRLPAQKQVMWPGASRGWRLPWLVRGCCSQQPWPLRASSGARAGLAAPDAVSLGRWGGWLLRRMRPTAQAHHVGLPDASVRASQRTVSATSWTRRWITSKEQTVARQRVPLDARPLAPSNGMRRTIDDLGRRTWHERCALARCAVA